MKKIINIGNDFSTKLSRPIVADDTHSYEIVFTAPEDISGCYFNVVATRADAEKVADAVLVEKGSVARYTLAGNMYQVPGTLKIRTSVVKKADGKTSTLTTNEIVCRVIEKTGEGSVDANTDVSIISKIQGDVGNLTTRMASAEKAVNETLPKSIEDVSEDATQKASEAESNAKAYTNEEVTEAKGVAKQYTDEKTSKALSDAKKYADDASFESEQNSNNYTDKKIGDLVVKHYFDTPEYPLSFQEKVISFDGMQGVEEIRFVIDADAVGKVCMSDGINRSEWFVFPEAKGGVRNSLLISRSKDNPCTVEYTTNEGNNRYHPVLPDGFLDAMKTATEVIYYGEDGNSWLTRIFYNTNVAEHIKKAKNEAKEYTDEKANTAEENAKEYADSIIDKPFIPKECNNVDYSTYVYLPCKKPWTAKNVLNHSTIIRKSDKEFTFDAPDFYGVPYLGETFVFYGGISNGFKCVLKGYEGNKYTFETEAEEIYEDTPGDIFAIMYAFFGVYDGEYKWGKYVSFKTIYDSFPFFLEENLGDVNNALDRILEIQNKLIGGDVE